MEKAGEFSMFIGQFAEIGAVVAVVLALVAI